MRLNDRLYDEMREELDREIEYIAKIEPELLYNKFEMLYFWRRVLSVLGNHDLPIQCALGLSHWSNRLLMLSTLRDSYIADDDSEAEIFKYILEIGYKAYDELVETDDDRMKEESEDDERRT